MDEQEFEERLQSIVDMIEGSTNTEFPEVQAALCALIIEEATALLEEVSRG